MPPSGRGLPDDAYAALAEIVGSEHALVDADVRAGYETDWTRRWHGSCDAVVRPGTTEEVAAVLAMCDDQRIGVVTQGGNTGLVGGGVPRAEPIGRPVVLLSTRRLVHIGAVDADAMQVTLGAGVTIAQWRETARAAGLDAPVDFAARDSATIGGAIATNAGGSRVLRFGTMRQQVAGIEGVLADGSVVGSLAGLPKETVGLHWPSLVAGSEGTLAVVTAARLRLVPRWDQVVTAMVAVDDLDDAVRLVGALRRDVPSLDAAELILPEALSLVCEHLGHAAPVPPAGATLLVECAAHDDPTDALLRVLADARGIVDTAVATGTPGRAALLEYRDRITEAIGAAASADDDTAYKLDVAVPVSSLPRLVAVARRAAHDAGARLVPFGHLAEGNVHLNYLGAGDGASIAATVLTEVAALGGTISAEHGIGVAKNAWLHLVRSPAELAAAARIRAALDPNEILNAGVLSAGTDPEHR